MGMPTYMLLSRSVGRQSLAAFHAGGKHSRMLWEVGMGMPTYMLNQPGCRQGIADLRNPL